MFFVLDIANRKRTPQSYLCTSLYFDQIPLFPEIEHHTLGRRQTAHADNSNRFEHNLTLSFPYPAKRPPRGC